MTPYIFQVRHYIRDVLMSLELCFLLLYIMWNNYAIILSTSYSCMIEIDKISGRFWVSSDSVLGSWWASCTWDTSSLEANRTHCMFLCPRPTSDKGNTVTDCLLVMTLLENTWPVAVSQHVQWNMYIRSSRSHTRHIHRVTFSIY